MLQSFGTPDYETGELIIESEGQIYGKFSYKFWKFDVPKYLYVGSGDSSGVTQAAVCLRNTLTSAYIEYTIEGSVENQKALSLSENTIDIIKEELNQEFGPMQVFFGLAFDSIDKLIIAEDGYADERLLKFPVDEVKTDIYYIPTGTTLKFNDVIDENAKLGKGYGYYAFEFESNGKTYCRIDLLSTTTGIGISSIHYYPNEGGGDIVTAYETDAWTDENYKTIKLSQGWFFINKEDYDTVLQNSTLS